MVNLIEIDMVDLDINLGMYCLYFYYATLDFRNGKVTFSFPNELIIEWEGSSLVPKGNCISYLRAQKFIS